MVSASRESSLCRGVVGDVDGVSGGSDVAKSIVWCGPAIKESRFEQSSGSNNKSPYMIDVLCSVGSLAVFGGWRPSGWGRLLRDQQC